MTSSADAVNEICKKVKGLEINSNPSSAVQDGGTLGNLANACGGDKATSFRALASTSQERGGPPGIGGACSTYMAPDCHPALYLYSCGGYNPYALELDGCRQSAFVNDFQYHLSGSENETAAVFYPPINGGYPQTFYGPPVASIPALSTDSIFYGPPVQRSGAVYQHVTSPECQYWSFPWDVFPGEVVMPGSEGLGIQGVYFNGIQNGNNHFLGGRPGFQWPIIPLSGSYDTGILPAALTTTGPVDGSIGYDSMRPAINNWMGPRSVEEHQKNGMPPGIYVTASQIVPAVGLCSPQPQQSVYSSHVTAGLHPLNGMSSGIPSGTQRRTNDGYQMQGGNILGFVLDNKRGIGNTAHFDDGQGILGSVNDAMDYQTLRPRNQGVTINGQARGQSGFANVNEILNVLGDRDTYNRSDFVTNYDNAKFFVIKSYSEDDIHKSIKYNVWASTPNGNQKLNEAYQDAQKIAGDIPGGCPVFFFFSVNGSGRFCGIAEMVGPVDFSKSMDFWQQDKWAGSFSVMWHIIKDVPNSQLRHIILENNDNKPVTNSRDTQEVNLQEGLDMLNIFKNYPARSSIMDDFYLYESRQRALQEKRAKHKVQFQAAQAEKLSREHFSDGLNSKADFKGELVESTSLRPFQE